MKIEPILLMMAIFANAISSLFAQLPADITGKWISAQQNVIVEIFSDGGEFKAKVVWFDDTDDVTRPRSTRMDIKNPVKSLRSRKIIGLEILRGLTFNNKCHCWQNGKIYDVQTGKTWSASIILENKNKARVRGFWHFEFMGRSMIFRRLKP